MIEASGGRRAIEKITATKSGKPIDIILLDMDLPGVSGIEVARHLSEERCGGKGASGPAVVMVTAKGRPGDIQRLEPFQVNGYLGKPVSEGLLFQCMTTAMAFKKAGDKRIITRHYLSEKKTISK